MYSVHTESDFFKSALTLTWFYSDILLLPFSNSHRSQILPAGEFDGRDKDSGSSYNSVIARALIIKPFNMSPLLKPMKRHKLQVEFPESAYHCLMEINDCMCNKILCDGLLWLFLVISCSCKLRGWLKKQEHTCRIFSSLIMHWHSSLGNGVVCRFFLISQNPKKVLLTGVFLLLPSLLPSLVFSSTVTLTPEGHSCCQKVTVEVTFVGIFCDCQYFYRMLLDFMLTSMESTSWQRIHWQSCSPSVLTDVYTGEIEAIIDEIGTIIREACKTNFR